MRALLSTILAESVAFLMHPDALALQEDAFIVHPDALALHKDALIMHPDALALHEDAFIMHSNALALQNMAKFNFATNSSNPLLTKTQIDFDNDIVEIFVTSIW